VNPRADDPEFRTRIDHTLESFVEAQRTLLADLGPDLEGLADAAIEFVAGGKQPRILFGTQPSTSPPTFVLFTTGKLEASYERYIERRLREEFGFVGTPIVVNQRPREKRKR